jgi:protein O-mannosyl-transferase
VDSALFAESRPRGSWLTPPLLATLAVALALFAYANSLNGPFTFDDRHEILTNRSIEDLRHPLAVLWYGLRPLTNLSYAVDYALWSGRNAFGFHLTNVVLHAVNVLMLFVLARSLARGGGSGEAAATLTAFLAAALFAVHPITTEAVSYVSSRSELLVTAMFLSTVYAFRRNVADGRGWLVVGSICLVLALAAKETAAVIPFVLLIADVIFSDEAGWRKRLWRLHAPLCGLILAAGLVRSLRYVALEVPGAESAMTWKTAATVALVAARYVGLLVLPLGQSVVPPVYPVESIRDARLVIVLVEIVAIAVLAVKIRRRAPLATFGLVWFALALVPSSALGLLARTGLLMAEHRVYLPSSGFFMAVATLIVPRVYRHPATVRRLVAIGGAVASVLFVLVYLTMERNRVWADPVRLWEEAARLAPDTPAAHLGLGNEYLSSGQCDRAQAEYRRTIELSPISTDAYLGLASCLLQRNQMGEAYRILRDAMDDVPRDDIRIRLALAGLEESAFRRPAEAVKLCQEALAIQPGDTDALDCVRRNQGELARDPARR